MDSFQEKFPFPFKNRLQLIKPEGCSEWSGELCYSVSLHGEDFLILSFCMGPIGLHDSITRT